MKKWNAVAVWSWNVLTDTCAICRNNLHEPSIEYQAQGYDQEQDHPGLSISWGACPPAPPTPPQHKQTLTSTHRQLHASESPRVHASEPPPRIAHPPAGSCGHVFHLDCIQRWLTTRSVCPLCNREWEFAKIERIGTGYGID